MVVVSGLLTANVVMGTSIVKKLAGMVIVAGTTAADGLLLVRVRIAGLGPFGCARITSPLAVCPPTTGVGGSESTGAVWATAGRVITTKRSPASRLKEDRRMDIITGPLMHQLQSTYRILPGCPMKRNPPR